MLRRSPLVLLLLAALSGSSEPASALPRSPLKPWSSATVPLNEPIYEELDRLDALGALPDQIMGQRPLSRGEIARILAEASKRPAATIEPVRTLLIRLRNEYPVYRAGEAQGVQSVTVGAAGTNASPRALPVENGIGSIEGMAYPLPAYREGAAYTKGGTFWLQTYHTQNPEPWLALAFRADFRLLAGHAAKAALEPVSGDDAVPLPLEESPDTETAGDFNVKALSGRLMFGPVVIQAGRDALAWGPLPRGGLHVSTNARPLDMLWVGHESAYRLPGFLRHLGPHRGAIFVADLGDSRTFENTLLFGIKTSFRPHRLAEVGFTEMLLIGGRGAPQPTAWEVVRQVFPIGHLGPSNDFSDHRFGLDLRIKVWPRRLMLYEELLFEDAREGYWTDVTASRTGLYTPAIGPGGAFEARLEYARLPAVLYRHWRWITGYTLDGRVIGDELGPDSESLRTEIRWNRGGGQRLTLEAAIEDRDADRWAQEPRPQPPADPGDTGDIFRLVDNPTERRWRLGLSGEFRVNSTMAWQPRFQAERIRNDRFEDGAWRTDFLAEVGLAIRLGREETKRPGVVKP